MAEAHPRMTASDWPWPAPNDDGAADHLEPGTRLPDLELDATPGEPVNLARRPGRAVVFVYPWTGRAGLANPPDWDDIPGAHGSTPQTEGFARAYDEFRATVAKSTASAARTALIIAS